MVFIPLKPRWLPHFPSHLYRDRPNTQPFPNLVHTVRERLTAKGFDETAVDAVRSPIGIVRGSKEPRAIALSVAAELLEVLTPA